jgi:tetratricopeptide (TPR) repeat protein
LGRYDEALKQFREGLALSPVTEDDVTATHIQYELAALYHRMGAKKLADRCYKSAERMARKAPLWAKDRYRMKQIAEIRALFRFRN